MMKRIFRRKTKTPQDCPEINEPKEQKGESEAPNDQKVKTDSAKLVQTSESILVGAIDFGSTYSGWAFSFSHDFKRDPTKARVKIWHSGSGSLTTEKAPMCILLKPDGKTAAAFGYDAENMYRELMDKDEHKEYYFFRRFKMVLHKKLGERIDRTITIEDEMGRPLQALNVFAIVIEYLIKDMLEEVNKSLSGIIKETDITWVLTVPAIWTDGAKQFMREAAKKAGVDDTKLTIALEPEAASIFCRHLSVETTVDGSGVSVSQFKPGVKYMVLDAGGGTIDITVHEVGVDGIKEVHAATGGDWGGTMVDKAFEDWLINVFGKELHDKFKSENTEDWQDFWRDFEVKKRAIKHDSTARVNMRIPSSLLEKYKSVSNTLSSSKDQFELCGDKIRFSPDCVRSFFTESIQKTTGLITDVLRDCDVKAILMVGGYSESPMLQHAIKTEFPDKDVIIPLGASSTILRGALIYGHSPRSISERVIKYTYGVEICKPFEEGKHPESKRLQYDGKYQCVGIFDRLVKKNQVVRVGKIQAKQSYHPTATNQSVIPIRIFASDKPNPRFVDRDCFNVGELTVEIAEPDEDLTREILLSLTFSGTEIVVEAEDKKAGRNFNISVDFLG